MKLWTILVLALGGFIVWQWFLSRRDPTLYDLDKNRKAVDKIGRGAEALQLNAKPRRMDAEATQRYPGIFETFNTLFSKVSKDGTVKNAPSTTPDRLDYDPFVFGYDTEDYNYFQTQETGIP